MYWLLLPAAALTLLLGLRTPSSASMAGWLLLTFLLLAGWVWMRYRVLFPRREGEARLTPLAPQEMDKLRQQTELLRAEARQPPPLTEAIRVLPVREAAPPQPQPEPDVTPSARSTPPPAPRPTGRAVFVLPDDPPAPSGPRQV